MTAAQNNGFLLCRPEGGLNDILSEIGKCIAYAKAYDRTVVVQTNSQSHTTFKDNFADYFIPKSEELVLDAAPFLDSFSGLSVQPAFVAGRLNTYSKAEVYAEDGQRKIGFDFSKDHPEPLLLHHSFGQQKGRNALRALARLTLQPALVEKLTARLGVLNANFSAFHVRHTDYKSDYESRARHFAKKVHGQVFLATDNKSVVDFFENLFGSARLFTFSSLPEEIGKPIHYLSDKDNAALANGEAILDLFTLCLAKEYYFFPRLGGDNLLAPYSGFSSLAARLRMTPNLLRGLLPEHLHSRIQNPSVLTKVKNLRWLYF